MSDAHISTIIERCASLSRDAGFVVVIDLSAVAAADEGVSIFPRRLAGQTLTPADVAILQALLARHTLGRAGLLAATHDPRKGDDDRSAKMADVRISLLRKKLRAAGISIETVHGVGWRLSPEQKARLRAAIEEALAS
ncbi:winged helix-turn-helix domain-containing protein [Methylocystis parvus]|uniref:winged helix-turn-helix domain-containing protein n=1 Tax=Methylocystis parvus TaxID=134 RepID=UPI003C7808F2